jgi:hypothetical protein
MPAPNAKDIYEYLIELLNEQEELNYELEEIRNGNCDEQRK